MCERGHKLPELIHPSQHPKPSTQNLNPQSIHPSKFKFEESHRIFKKLQQF